MSRRIGFTLIEILVVLIILVLVMSLGISAMRGPLARQQLKYSADRIRGEWLDTKVRAMEEGQIFCMRCKIGGSTLVIDRVLDTHFTAGLSSRQTSSRFDAYNEYDPFEQGGFTGDMQDFILRDPSAATEGYGTIVLELPETVVIADVIAIAEERAAFYLGLTDPLETESSTADIEGDERNILLLGETRLGETAGTAGTAWSTPIFFYPDGSTSTAAILLKNETGRCMEVRLRGLTGTGMATEIMLTTDYTGELNVNRF
ncbi:MAG: prepilin-type N-terminal cleavage/methylation domain-containing protein [Planctomycetaceae bacterium]|jgi:prepilin-type N-terminal cleavage/methylation domain-containing protein|nr:prepilin-type N-terminal cleavage/methylation domain-containing protein [Planctomycetaceae bacterium]